MIKEELDIKLIDWSEVQKQVDLIKGNRKDGWGHIITSPDGRFEIEYKYVTEIRFGPAFYSVKIQDVKSNDTIWNGNDRLFGMPPQKDYLSPWSIDSSMIGLVEWNSNRYGDQSPILIDLKEMNESKLKYSDSLTFHLLTADKKQAIFKSFGKENKTILINNKSEVKTIGLDKSHRNLLVANTSNPNKIVVIDQINQPKLNIVNTTTGQILDSISITPQIFEKLGQLEDIPHEKDIFSGEKDLGILKVGATSKLSQGNAKGNVWDDLIWDSSNDRYFLGIMRANSWGQDDYYKGQEWIEIRIKTGGNNVYTK